MYAIRSYYGQWGTVREDYSEHGTAWDYFPHDHARSRVYRWGEDGIAGISDDMQRLCFAIILAFAGYYYNLNTALYWLILVPALFIFIEELFQDKKNRNNFV